MRAKTDVLIFVEDPGAANYVAQLPEALAERGWRTLLLADGSAKRLSLGKGRAPRTGAESSDSRECFDLHRPAPAIGRDFRKPRHVGVNFN